MSAGLATRLIDDIGALLLVTMLIILASGQLFRAIYAVAAQSVFLGIAGAVLATATETSIFGLSRGSQSSSKRLLSPGSLSEW